MQDWKNSLLTRMRNLARLGSIVSENTLGDAVATAIAVASTVEQSHTCDTLFTYLVRKRSYLSHTFLTNLRCMLS